MQLTLTRFIILIIWILRIAITAGIIYVFVRVIKRIEKTTPVKKEKSETAKTLGEVIRLHRIECKMTQEFIAESIGVSRQAVSKWESGASEPSTSNLIALAKLFNLSADSLIKEIAR